MYVVPGLSLGRNLNRCSMDEDNALTLEDFEVFRQKRPKKERVIQHVVEYDMDGVYLNEYSSCKEAAKNNDMRESNIQAVCIGRALYSRKLQKIFLYRGSDIGERMTLIHEAFSKNKSVPKAVYEYSLRGNLIFRYDTSVMASKVNKVSPALITYCCKGKRLYIGNRIFLYKDGDIKQRVKEVRKELYRLSKKRPRYMPVDVYTLEGEYLGGYPSATAAAKELNVCVSDVTSCCYGVDGKSYGKLSTGGRIFLWVGDSIKERLKQINNKKK